MKRLIVLVLCLMVALSLPACGRISQPVETEPLDPDLKSLVGTVQEQVYTNEKFGIPFQITDRWNLGSRETLAEESGIAQYTAPMATEHLKNGESLTILYAKNILGTSIVNLCVSVDDREPGLTLEEYTDRYNQLVAEGLTRQGMTVTELERTAVNISGKDPGYDL